MKETKKAPTLAKATTRITYETIKAIDFARAVKNEDILIPEFQRPLVWTGKDVTSLFVTIANGEPIPSIILGCEDGETPLLIDGQQRANAISFMLEKFENEGAVEPIKILENYELPVIKFSADESILSDYFLRVNAKSGLSTGEKEKGTLLPQYQFELNNILNDEDSIFLDTFGKTSVYSSKVVGKDEKGKDVVEKVLKYSYKGLTDKLIACLTAWVSVNYSTSTASNIKELKASNKTMKVEEGFKEAVERASEIIGSVDSKKVVNSLIYLVATIKINPKTPNEVKAMRNVLRSIYVKAGMLPSVNGIPCKAIAKRENDVKNTLEKVAEIKKMYLKGLAELESYGNDKKIETANAKADDSAIALGEAILG